MASIIIASLVLIALYLGTKRLSGLEALGVAILTIVGIVFVIFPALSTRVANFLHVGRGTDLIFYLAVLAGMFVASSFYVRFKRHEAALITLARQNAINTAYVPPSDAAEASGSKSDRAVKQVEQDLHRIEP